MTTAFEGVGGFRRTSGQGVVAESATNVWVAYSTTYNRPQSYIEACLINEEAALSELLSEKGTRRRYGNWCNCGDSYDAGIAFGKATKGEFVSVAPREAGGHVITQYHAGGCALGHGRSSGHKKFTKGYFGRVVTHLGVVPGQMSWRWLGNEQLHAAVPQMLASIQLVGSGTHAG